MDAVVAVTFLVVAVVPFSLLRLLAGCSGRRGDGRTAPVDDGTNFAARPVATAGADFLATPATDAALRAGAGLADGRVVAVSMGDVFRNESTRAIGLATAIPVGRRPRVAAMGRALGSMDKLCRRAWTLVDLAFGAIGANMEVSMRSRVESKLSRPSVVSMFVRICRRFFMKFVFNIKI